MLRYYEWDEWNDIPRIYNQTIASFLFYRNGLISLIVWYVLQYYLTSFFFKNFYDFYVINGFETKYVGNRYVATCRY